ncbi:MAG TPA: N-acetylmuramoyl-L-alanine amidase [Tepidisphaeraceae bacterium]|nr:N-acetylmuramoyl-L-alanine amidase [Tepidisphaeraceae bacterium]
MKTNQRQTPRTGRSGPALRPVAAARKPASTAPRGYQAPRRGLVVFGSLIGVLGLTGVLLRAMQTPLTADAATTTMPSYGAVPDPGRALLAVFNTRVPASANRWKAIYVHHTRTTNGSAAELAQAGLGGDHFVIGNGKGALDGEIQFTDLWDRQQPGAPAAGAAKVDPNCVSIALVGDFDHAPPTPTQLARLVQLVQTLQERLHVPASQVWMCDYANSPVGVGKFFPISAFQGQLLK